ncbi:hypothetical protein BSKO_03396 [Bryopsis sp. KO-2023]|nr:hypothetical protein BSKO_03396 [Bryopsis sp. KO-2023]
MLRRSRPDDSATEFPSPQQLAGSPEAHGSSEVSSQSSAPEHPYAWAGALEPKKSHEYSEIDAVIGCLAAVVNCCTGPKAFRASWRCRMQMSTLCILATLLVVGIGLYTYPKDEGESWWTPMMNSTFRSSDPAMEKIPSQDPAVGVGLAAEKTPVGAVISTHHRTGTVLFQNMGERLCEVFLMDYERVDEPFKLQEPNATRTLLYQRYWNATERVVVTMHGFTEECPEGQDVGMYCKPLDYDCWLGACKVIQQDPQTAVIPVAHVVRNPVEVLISAYLYHQQDPPPEEWLYNAKPDALEILPMDLQEQYATVPYYKVLQQLPPELGILCEFTVEMEEIYRMTRNYRDMALLSSAKNLHFESFKKEFEQTVKTALDHLEITKKKGSEKVMQIAMIFDLSSMPEIERRAYQVENHITEGKHDKDDLRKMLYSNTTTRAMLNKLATQMDYPTAFPSLETGVPLEAPTTVAVGVPVPALTEVPTPAALNPNTSTHHGDVTHVGVGVTQRRYKSRKDMLV